MSFNVSGLTEYVEANGKEIALRSITEAKTASILIQNNAAQYGIKGKAAIRLMDADVNFQDGDTCSRTAIGNVTLADKNITVASITDFQNICPKALYNTHYSYALSQGQNPQTEGFAADFGNYVMKLRSTKINSAVDFMLWQGDTTLTGNNSKIDGVVKQITVGGTASHTDISNSETDLVKKFQTSFLAMPIAVSGADDFRIWVGEDMYNQYLVALANKNIYKNTDDMSLFGTNAKFQPVPGLNGTSKVVMARISNILLGMDGTDETDKASMEYSIETKNWYQDFHFAVGIAVVYVSETGYAQY